MSAKKTAFEVEPKPGMLTRIGRQSYLTLSRNDDILPPFITIATTLITIATKQAAADEKEEEAKR